MNKVKLVFPALVMLFIIGFPLKAQQVSGMKYKWGEFGAGPGQFKFPAMITSNTASEIYVVDQHNHRIQKFDANGNFLLMWGKQGNAEGEFNYPYGIAADSKGNVYVTDMQNNRIQKFSASGEFLAASGSYGKGEGHFKYPYGIAIDKDDILYVVDAFNYRIQKLSSDLGFISAWGNQEKIGFKLYMPHELVVSKDGNIILSDRQNHRISIFTKDGDLVKRFGDYCEGPQSGADRFSEPHGITVNAAGEIFVCDRYNFRVHKFTSDGKDLFHWTTSGNHDDSKHFPLGITVPENNNIYITDHFAHCIQVY